MFTRTIGSNKEFSVDVGVNTNADITIMVDDGIDAIFARINVSAAMTLRDELNAAIRKHYLSSGGESVKILEIELKTKTLLLSDSYMGAVQTAADELVERGCEIVQVVSSTDTFTGEFGLIYTARDFLIIYKEGAG